MTMRTRLAAAAVLALIAGWVLMPDRGYSAPVGGLHPHRASFFAPPPLNGEFPGGPTTPSRPNCKAGQIESAAFTESSPAGVLGVVELKGTKTYHSKIGERLRCALPILKGPRGLIAPDGDRLAVPRGKADKTNPGDNLFSWIDLADGKAAWGFGWFGTYCGQAPRYVVMKLEGHLGTLNVPYDGPTPPCPADPATAASTLTDGAAGGAGAAVPPAPPHTNS
jgi:hypothetical protein